MAQVSDQSVDNAAGGTVRAQLNDILAALFSSNQGATAPSPTVAGMLWLDTGVSPAVARIRNTANTGWIALSPETIPAYTLRGNPTGSAAAEGAVDMAQLQTMLGISNGTGLLKIGGKLLQWGNASVGAGGTTLTFPQAFAAAPRMQVSLTASAAAFATFQTLTATSVFLQAWNTSAAAVPGNVHWLAAGDA